MVTKSHSYNKKRFVAFLIAIFMVIEVIKIMRLEPLAATPQTVDVSTSYGFGTGADGIFTITDATTYSYTFTGIYDGSSKTEQKAETIAIVIDVGAGNTVDITFDNLYIRRKNNGQVSSGAIIQVRSGNVNINLVGDNSIICPQDAQGGPGSPDGGYGLEAVSINGGTVTFTGSGLLNVNGSSNYWGGGHAFSGGTVVLDGTIIYANGGNNANPSVPYGEPFFGTSVELRAGTLNCKHGELGKEVMCEAYVNDLMIQAGATFNASSVSASDTVTNNGTINGNVTVASTGSCENNGTIDGDVNNSGTFDNTSNGTITSNVVNSGASAQFTNEGKIEGNVSNEASATFSMNAPSTAAVDSCYVKGVFTNKGTLTSTGTSDFGTYVSSGNTYIKHKNYIKTLECYDGSTSTIDHVSIDALEIKDSNPADTIYANLSVGNATVLEMTAPAVSGNQNKTQVKFTGTMYIDSLDIYDFDSTGSPDVYVYTSYNIQIADTCATGAVNVNTIITENTRISGNFIVDYAGKTYEGYSSSPDTLSNIFTEDIIYVVGDNVTIDGKVDTHGCDEDFHFVVKADEGYYFPSDYEDGIEVLKTETPSSDCEEIEILMIDPYQQYQISYTIDTTSVSTFSTTRENIKFTIPSATKKTTPKAPVVKSIHGYLLDTTKDMEYAASKDATEWTSCTDTKTEVKAGTWYVRYKETYATLPGEATEIYVSDEFEISVSNPTTSGFTWLSTSGAEVQKVIEGEKLISITYIVADGYYLPENYSMEDVNGITITRNDYNSVTISGVPTKTTMIELAAASSKYMALVVPEDVYSVNVSKGENKYFSSYMTITAKDGYLVSKTIDGKYTKKIIFTDSSEGENIYFMDDSIGLISPAVHIDGFLIDAASPTASVDSGAIYYGDEKTVTIEDDNLVSVTLNGEEVELIDGKAILILLADGAEMEYEIVATDIAGNKTVIVYTVAATWTQSGIIPVNVAVKLKPDTKYTLDAGEWKVEGDSTSYMGGNSFYINDEGKYTFTQAEEE